jgi:YD repeat-containing protein
MIKRALAQVLILLLSSFWLIPASALPYHWEVNVSPSGWQGINYPSAVATCAVGGIVSGANTYKYLTFTYNTEEYGQCVYAYYYNGIYQWDTSLGTIAHRFGDSCVAGTTYNPTTGACDAVPADVGQPCPDSANPSNPNIRQTDGTCKPISKTLAQNGAAISGSCPVRADPINFSVGNSFQAEVDYQGGSGSPLNFSRAYNSIDGIWRHNYSTNLRLGDTFTVLVLNDGREVYFTVAGTTATSTAIGGGSLRKVGTEWVYNTPNGQRFTYNAQGRLTRIDLPQGPSQLITRSSNKLTVSSAGSSFSFYEDPLHQPLTFTANGVSIVYTYNTRKRLNSLQRTFSPSGRVEQRSFIYDGDSTLLTGITDERGIRHVTWVYDNQGRALSSEKQNGAGKVAIAYNSDGTVTVTNELGKQTLFHLELINGARHITKIEGEPTANCPESNASYTYDERGQMLSKTDAKGLVTTYTYNDRGLETTRTQASGTPQARTTTTTWHATFNLPLTVTEGGQVTTYTYDTQGRQTSRTQTAL